MLTSSTPETEWDDQQRAWMLALAIHRAGLCPICGGPIDDCGPDTRGTWQVPPPRRCQRTDAVLLVQEDRKHTPRPAALMYRAVKQTT